jgi:hypothetical protein
VKLPFSPSVRDKAVALYRQLATELLHCPPTIAGRYRTPSSPARAPPRPDPDAPPAMTLRASLTGDGARPGLCVGGGGQAGRGGRYVRASLTEHSHNGGTAGLMRVGWGVGVGWGGARAAWGAADVDGSAGASARRVAVQGQWRARASRRPAGTAYRDRARRGVQPLACGVPRWHRHRRRRRCRCSGGAWSIHVPGAPAPCVACTGGRCRRDMPCPPLAAPAQAAHPARLGRQRPPLPRQGARALVALRVRAAAADPLSMRVLVHMMAVWQRGSD